MLLSNWDKERQKTFIYLKRIKKKTLGGGEKLFSKKDLVSVQNSLEKIILKPTTYFTLQIQY